MKNGKFLWVILISCIFVIILNFSNFIMVEKLDSLVGLVSGHVNLEVIMDSDPPEILDCLATPKVVIVNNSINFTLAALDNDRILDTSIILTLPNLTNITYNNLDYTPNSVGEYFIHCGARDYRYNQNSVQTNFIAIDGLDYSLNLTSSDNIEIDVTLYYPDSNIEIINFFNRTIITEILPAYYFDVKFNKVNNKINVVLTDVNLSINNNKYFNSYSMATTLSSFKSNYVIETDIKFENATVNFNYSSFNLVSDLEVWVCHDWDLKAESCSGEWELIDSIQNKDEQTLTLTVTEFSAFGLKESTPPIVIIPTIRRGSTSSGSSDGSIILPEEPHPDEIKEVEEVPTPRLEKPYITVKLHQLFTQMLSLKVILWILILLVILESLNYWNIIKNNKKK